MRVKDIMTGQVECIGPNDTLAFAAERMRDLNVGSLPVCEDGERPQGIVTDRDITIRGTAAHCDPENTRVSEIMTPQISYCFDDEDISEAANQMEEEQIRRLPVLSRDMRLVGIVSLGDLAVRGQDTHLSGEALEQISEPVLPMR